MKQITDKRYTVYIPLYRSSTIIKQAYIKDNSIDYTIENKKTLVKFETDFTKNFMDWHEMISRSRGQSLDIIFVTNTQFNNLSFLKILHTTGVWRTRTSIITKMQSALRRADGIKLLNPKFLRILPVYYKHIVFFIGRDISLMTNNVARGEYGRRVFLDSKTVDLLRVCFKTFNLLGWSRNLIFRTIRL